MGRPTRILYTIPNFVTAGSGQAMVNIIDRLDRNRFEPTVAVAQFGGPLTDHLLSTGVRVIEAPFMVDVTPLPLLPYRLWRSRRHFHGQFDIWHSFNWQGDFTEPLIAYLSGARSWVFTKKNMGFSSKSWRIRSFLARRIAVQNDEMTRLFFASAWFHRKVRYIPTGIDVEPWQRAPTDNELRSRLGIHEAAVLVVCVGDVQPRKNQSAITPVLEDENVHVLLAGRVLDSDYEAEIRHHATMFDAQDRLHLLGTVADVPGLLKACDVFALLSHAEGSPIAMLEAMAVGLPGVYATIPGIRERIRDGRDGFLVDPSDSDQISDRLGQLIASRDLRSAMGDQAQSSVELRGRVEAEVARYETMYLELI